MKKIKKQYQSKNSYHNYILKQNRSDTLNFKADFSNNAETISYFNDSGLIGKWSIEASWFDLDILKARSHKEIMQTINKLNRV